MLGCLELEGRVVYVEVGRQACPEMVQDVAGPGVLAKDDMSRDDISSRS